MPSFLGVSPAASLSSEGTGGRLVTAHVHTLPPGVPVGAACPDATTEVMLGDLWVLLAGWCAESLPPGEGSAVHYSRAWSGWCGSGLTPGFWAPRSASTTRSWHSSLTVFRLSISQCHERIN